MILASQPEKPSSAPTRKETTNEFTVAVNIEIVEDNGSQITSYSIEIDDGKGGDFS